MNLTKSTYKLEKVCDKFLELITTCEYTIKDSFSIAKEFEQFDPDLVIARI